MKVGTGQVPNGQALLEAKEKNLISKYQYAFLAPLSEKRVRDLPMHHQERIADISSEVSKKKKVVEKKKKVEKLTAEVDKETKREAYKETRAVVTKHWPKFGPVFDLTAGVFSTLCLKNRTCSVALILVGGSGKGKSTFLNLFIDAFKRRPDALLYIDNFTTSALQSGHGDASKKQVEENALFKLTTNKLFICSDMGPLLRGGNDEQRRTRFGAIAHWLDGTGISRGTGTHGVVGDKGKYQTAMVGATTPINMQMWRAMSTLGPRFLFYQFPDLTADEFIHGQSVGIAMEECSTAIVSYIDKVFPKDKNVIESSEWPEDESPKIEKQCQMYSELTATAQTMSEYGETIERPATGHFNARLAMLMAGMALAKGKDKVGKAELAMARRLSIKSTPLSRGPILFSIAAGAQTVKDVVQSTGLSPTSVSTQVEKLESLGILKQTSIMPPQKWRYVTTDEYVQSTIEMTTPEVDASELNLRGVE